MQALTSYIRHVIVVGVLYLLAKYKLPVEGADEFANAVALVAIGSGTWLLVKYAPKFAKDLGLLGMALLAVLSLPSCAPGTPVTFRLLAPGGSLAYNAETGISVAADISPSGK